jgi:hypothetical protein
VVIMPLNALPLQANEVGLDLSHARFSFATIGVPNDELPGAVGLSAEDLDRPVTSLDRLARRSTASP